MILTVVTFYIWFDEDDKLTFLAFTADTNLWYTRLIFRCSFSVIRFPSWITINYKGHGKYHKHYFDYFWSSVNSYWYHWQFPDRNRGVEKAIVAINGQLSFGEHSCCRHCLFGVFASNAGWEALEFPRSFVGRSLQIFRVIPRTFYSKFCIDSYSYGAVCGEVPRCCQATERWNQTTRGHCEIRHYCRVDNSNSVHFTHLHFWLLSQYFQMWI